MAVDLAAGMYSAARTGNLSDDLDVRVYPVDLFDDFAVRHLPSAADGALGVLSAKVVRCGECKGVFASLAIKLHWFIETGVCPYRDDGRVDFPHLGNEGFRCKIHSIMLVGGVGVRPDGVRRLSPGRGGGGPPRAFAMHYERRSYPSGMIRYRRS